MEEQKHTRHIRMADVNLTESVITLNLNGFNSNQKAKTDSVDLKNKT